MHAPTPFSADGAEARFEILTTRDLSLQPSPEGADGHQGFGVVSGTINSMRQVQLGLKYTF